MPVVHFVGNIFGPSASVDVPEGGPLVDVCDEAGAPVPFSCRSASCGTCRIEILEGAEYLEAPSREESEVLAIFADPPTHRLACSACLKPGIGAIRIAIVDDG